MVSEHLDQFNQAGLEVEPFGGSTVAIKAMPVELSHLDPKAFLRDLIEEAQVEDRLMIQKENPQYRIFAVMACKGAIKANDPLMKQEVTALCRDLDAIPNFATCPHGRPTYHFFSVRELEKMFRRT
jgi:DNA mismatch repair protein MutL